MQIPVTIATNIFPINLIKDFHGEKVPFEVETYQKDFLNSERGGFFDLTHWGVIEISGPDAAGYLQRMSTTDIRLLVVGAHSAGAFLTGKGTLIAMGTFVRLETDRFLFVISANQTERVLSHLEMFHFQEKLEIKDKTSDFAVLGVWNSKDSFLSPSWISPREGRLAFVLIERSKVENEMLALNQKGFVLLGMHLFHYFRIQSGLPWMGWEVRESDLILEASLDDFVARNKGCYPGQEVVERIFTYGQVNRKLMKVELGGVQMNEATEEVEIKNAKGDLVGTLMSVVKSPQQTHLGVGLAYVKKAFWTSLEEFQTGEGVIVKVRGLHD